jgi:hypothetical protein
MADLISRRSLIGALVALPVGLFVVHCSSNDSSGDTSPGAPPQRVGTQTIYTSSNTSGHTHTFAIDDASLTAPPAAGLSGPTSVDSGHSHDVTVPMASLQQIAAGQSVQVTTSGGSHTHVFTFVKIA